MSGTSSSFCAVLGTDFFLLAAALEILNLEGLTASVLDFLARSKFLNSFTKSACLDAFLSILCLRLRF